MNILLGLLQVFIAIGALPAGYAFITDPTGAALDMPLSQLAGSIFPNYLIPGLFLFAVNGLGSLAGAWLSFRKNRYAGPAAMALGLMLVAWIVIQVIVIRSFHWLQPLYFGLGLVELGLGVVIMRRGRK